MSRHRLLDVMPSGVRWCNPASGVVFVAADGDVQSVTRGVLGNVGRHVDTGRVWLTTDGDN
jgi:hypothetical protein